MVSSCSPKKCETCGVVFNKKPNYSKSAWENKVKYCSHPCYAIALSKKVHVYMDRTKTCEQCGEKYISKRAGKDYKNQKYCSLKCISISKSGSKHCNFGKKMSEEQKAKISKSHQGSAPWNKGLRGEANPTWKGGDKASGVRYKAKRRALGFIPLNECLDDSWVGHHMDFNNVLYIPEAMHISVAHSVLKDKNMDKINSLVYEWYDKEYIPMVIGKEYI